MQVVRRSRDVDVGARRLNDGVCRADRGAAGTHGAGAVGASRVGSCDNGRPVPTIGRPLRELEREEWLRELWRKEEEELWDLLGEQFVQRLKEGAGMQGMIVTVGKRTLKLERKGVEWIERE
jgi:hypothetical protein